MLLTPHSLTGATIAVLIPNPFISIPLALGSHFILDSIPHWQETLYPYNPNKFTWIRIPIDVALGLYMVFWITQSHANIASTIWVTAIAANIPDIDSVAVIIPIFFKNKLFKKYWDFHCKIQRETSSYLGLVPQLILSAVCLIVTL